MIGFLQGKVLDLGTDTLILLANQVGYEVLLPATVMETLKANLDEADGMINLHIYYHQTDRQPKPVLIGFDSKEEKDFFQLFITVDSLGPLKAAKAMEHPVSVIARAIEQKDVAFLSTLKGIGRRSAQKIVAALQGKASGFVGEQEASGGAAKEGSTSGDKTPSFQKVIDQVVEVLVQQLGHASNSARKMVAEALERNPGIETPEALFDEVYRGDDDR